MRVLHLLQPAACPSPPWNGNDQRADSPCLVVAELLRRGPEERHRAVVIGGSEAAADARTLGLECPHLAPPLGVSWLVARELSKQLHREWDSELVVGWGSQYQRVFDATCRARACAVVDLRTGRLRTRQPRGDWIDGPSLPARLEIPIPATDWKRPPGGPFRVGLCWDGPSPAPTVAYAFTLGALAAGGHEAGAMVRRGIRDGARLARHSREGGRIVDLTAFQGPLLPRAGLAEYWIMALPSRGGPIEPPYTDWSTLVLADAMAAAGTRVLGVGDGCAWQPARLRPRVAMLAGSRLSDAATGLASVFESEPVVPVANRELSASAILGAALARLARGESPGEEERTEVSRAG
ncbi:MAG: hypothetical protein ACOYN0_07945 [Phycisphaerales bacterium]